MDATLFDRLDQAQLSRVVTPIGLAFCETVARLTKPMCDDDGISPTALIAGVAKAHALGIAAVLFGGGLALSDGDPARAELLREELLQAVIATMRAELLAPGVTDATVQ